MEGNGVRLQPEIRALAEGCLERIVAATPAPGALRGNGSLAGGAAGLALLHAHLHRLDPGLGFRERALAFLAAAAGCLAGEPMGPGLMGGVAGIAWAHGQTLATLGETDLEDGQADLDRALEQYLARGASGLGFDLVDGLAGLGIYGLQRARAGGRRVILDAVVTDLARRAVAADPGMTWFTPPGALPAHQRREAPGGYFNLGLAHGVPALPALLGQVLALGLGGAPERRLYGEAVAWLLAQRNPEPARAGLGCWVAQDEDEGQRGARRREPLRVAWCYGDLGAGVALLRGACALDDAATAAAALELCRRAARCPVPEAGMADACLCHGAAGNAHLFHRLFRATGEPVFAAAAEAHLRQVLAWEEPAAGGAGFRFWLPRDEDDPEPWRADPGLLNGAAGIGLALLGFLDGREPAWDGCLMADLPGWR
jgi:hypothetical protein